MKTILITGGCGFIGSNLIRYLLKVSKWRINILDNLSTGAIKPNDMIIQQSDRVNFFSGDIRNVDDITPLIKSSDYIVNLAAQTSVIDSLKNPFYDQDVNIIGLLNLLNISKDNSIEKFIHASSAAAVGEQDMPMDETKIPRPISPYGASKLAGEGYCSAFSNAFEMKAVVLRFSNVYGPLSYHKGSVASKFIKETLTGKPLDVYGDGNQTRDFIYVDDICKGIFLALKKDTDLFSLIQLGTGKETSINELIDYLKRISSKHKINFPAVKHVEERSGEIYRNFTDISNAIRILDFSLDFSIQEGLQNTVEWFVNEYKK
jgi:UDP-glucose 4-epimerase